MSNELGQRQSRGRLAFAFVMCLAGIVLVFMVGGSRTSSALPIFIRTLLAGAVFSSFIFSSAENEIGLSRHATWPARYLGSFELAL